MRGVEKGEEGRRGGVVEKGKGNIEKGKWGGKKRVLRDCIRNVVAIF